MRKLKLLLTATALLLGGGISVWAQTDVTSTYLTNADFSSTTGWTQYKSNSFSDIGTGMIGWKVKNYNSTTDDTHLDTEYCFGFECRWGDKADGTYSSYYQETMTNLPVGHYELTYDVQNTNTATSNGGYSNKCYVKVGETTYQDEGNEWRSSHPAWTSHKISFDITEEAKAIISLGYGAGTTHNKDANTPVLYVSHLKLTWTDPNAAANAAKLEVAKYTLNGYIKKATALNGVLGTLTSAIETAQGVYDTATDYASHYDGVVSASTTLNSAITTALSRATAVSLTNGDFNTTPNNTLDGEGNTVYGGTLSTATSNPDNTKEFSANTGDHAYLYDVTGWTQYSKFNSTASQGTTSEYGTAMPENGYSTNSTTIPTTDMLGGKSGAALHLSAGWGDQARYQQTIENLPSGRYVFYYEVINQYSNTNIASNYIGVNGASGDFYGTTNSFVYSGLNSIEQGVWKAQAFEFNVAKTANINFSVGVTTSTGTSGNGAKLWVDNILVYRIGDVVVTDADAEALITQVEALNDAVYNSTDKSTLSTAKTTFEANKTLDNYNALNAALIAANASVSVYTALNAAITKVEGWTATTAAAGIRAKYTNGEYTNETAADIFTAYQAAEIAAIGAAEGTDFTSVILNQSFETGDMTGWSAEGRSDTGVKRNDNGTYTINNDVDGNYIFNSWGGSAENNVYQTIANLPAGTYQLSALLAGFTGEELVLAANDVTNSVTVSGDKTTGNTVNVVFTLTEAGNVTIKASNTKATSADASFIKADNFRLVTFSDPLAPYKEQLREKKELAQQTLENDDYANVTGSEKSTLTAKAAVTPEETEEAYATAISELSAAISAFTAAKTNYDIFASYNTTLSHADTDKKPAITSESTAASIITALRAYYESHALAEKSDGAVNCADDIAGADPDTNTGWTGGIGTDNRSWEMYTDASGNAGGRYYDGGWSQSAAANINMSREISLPAGTYLLTVTARGSESLTSYTMSVAGESVDLPRNGSGENVGVFGHGWDDVSLEFESDGNPVTLTIAANSTEYQQWISFNRFRLMRLSLNTSVYAGETEYAALNNAISTAEAKTLGFENEQFAPYNNVAALEALAAAKAIDQTAELTNLKTDVQAATTALNNATWTLNDGEVNAIHNGNFATAEDLGWNFGNIWGQFVSGLNTNTNASNGTARSTNAGNITYGNKVGYTIPLKASTDYRLTFKVASWDNNNKNTGTDVSILNTSSEGLATISFGASGTNRDQYGAFKTYTTVFTTGAASDYTLTITAKGNRSVYTDIVLVKAVADEITIDEDANYTPEASDYANVTLKRTFSNTNWNSFVVPFDIDNATLTSKFGTVEVAEYSETAEGENSTVSFTKMETPAITANKPVLLKTSTAPAQVTFDLIEVKTGDAKIAGEGNFDFVGTYAATTDIEAGDYFIASNKLYKSSGSTTIKGTRAYIKAKSDEARIADFWIEGGETTGISTMQNAQSTMYNEVFDLQGRKVAQPVKGMYIKNGKKVIVK